MSCGAAAFRDSFSLDAKDRRIGPEEMLDAAIPKARLLHPTGATRTFVVHAAESGGTQLCRIHASRFAAGWKPLVWAAVCCCPSVFTLTKPATLNVGFVAVDWVDHLCQ